MNLIHKVFNRIEFMCQSHYVKSDRIQSYSGPYFPAFGLNTERYGVSENLVRMREDADQNNSEYGHFSCSIFCFKSLIYIGRK